MSENHSMDVAYIAKLASLDLSDQEKELFQAQLDQVLEYVEQLNEVEVPETIGETNRSVPLSRLREDIATGSIPHEAVVQNAPASTNGCIRVPKIIDQ
jgi:aspartyl-tRNA(Asn)/glutamyl-tRNA(Gln) amidotransferase subunit C